VAVVVLCAATATLAAVGVGLPLQAGPPALRGGSAEVGGGASSLLVAMAVGVGLGVAAAARSPPGTPTVEPLKIRQRPRRNRKMQAIRDTVAETSLTAANLIQPIFVHDAPADEPIPSMPGVSRISLESGLLPFVERAVRAGVHRVVIFPKTPESVKSGSGEESFNPAGLAQRAIAKIKAAFPEVMVFTDVALDPYNSLGHDGIVRSDGVVMNDETIHQLCKQAVSQAQAGADCVSPSDMMDGRIGAIRDALDAAGFQHVSIMAYTAKYASSFYGPFRDALDSAPASLEGWQVPKDKRTYQQDPSNVREALREARLDEEEGADIMMVKPAVAYLDVIRALRENTTLPIAAYHVSGEYAMIKAAAERGWLDERRAVLETLTGIRRAGADVILTYFATTVGEWIRQGHGPEH